jgi:hypothetical protein
MMVVIISDRMLCGCAAGDFCSSLFGMRSRSGDCNEMGWYGVG